MFELTGSAADMSPYSLCDYPTICATYTVTDDPSVRGKRLPERASVEPKNRPV